MQPIQRLDLSGIVIPICYFVFKRALADIETGAILEVQLQDPDTLKDLMIMIDRSNDEVAQLLNEQGWFLLRVRKGPPAGPPGDNGYAC